jgi:transposase-like protein
MTKEAEIKKLGETPEGINTALDGSSLNGYYRHLLTLEQAQDADRALSSMENYPLIMTQSQYDRTAKAAQNKKRAFLTSYRSIVFDMLQYYTEQYEIDEEASEIPEAIKTAIKAMEKEPVTNKRIPMSTG